MEAGTLRERLGAGSDTAQGSRQLADRFARHERTRTLEYIRAGIRSAIEAGDWEAVTDWAGAELDALERERQPAERQPAERQPAERQPLACGLCAAHLPCPVHRPPYNW